MEILLIILLIATNLLWLRSHIINTFKILFYQQKFKNKNMHDSVKDYGLRDIFRSE